MIPRNIKLIVSYNGAPYCGWQRQRGLPSVQGKIEAALEKIHKHPVALNGSGRTDSGVHAVGQAANFYTDIAGMAAPRFVPALNGLLPRDIRILDAEEVPMGFHARFDAKSRLYRYFFTCGKNQGHDPRSLRLWRYPDTALLNGYARFLRGEFDCTIFAGSGDKSLSKNRRIFNAVFFMENGKLVFEIRANAFLWKMVRSAAGTMLFYEEKQTNPEDFSRIIASGKRDLAGPTLPPDGLFLWKIDY